MTMKTRTRMTHGSSLMLALVVAALATLVAWGERLLPETAPVYGQPSAISLRVPTSFEVTVHESSGELREVDVSPQRVIVPRGTVLTTADPDHRLAVAWEGARRPAPLASLGATGGMYALMLFGLSIYLRRYGNPRLKLLRSQIGLFGLLLTALIATKAWALFSAQSLLWVPLGTACLWLSLGFDRRTAAVSDLVLAFLAASLVGFDVVTMLVFAGRGLGATLAFRQRQRHRRLVLAGLVGAGSGVLVIGFVLAYLGGTQLLWADLQAGWSRSDVVGAVGGGLASGLLAAVLAEPAMVVLGQVSRSKLLDLTDIELPLLRKMATEAPGSWEHARAMANLAEGAAAAIGADALLTRVGAYYHDLGKTVKPDHFIENLGEGEVSPHKSLPPEESAAIIVAHVVQGTEILREGGIPEPVVEFAYTHHGTQVVEYFWNQYQQAQGADAELGRSHFQYPGMRPLSKETGILMLVDAVEAASRTVQPPTLEKFTEMVQRIVFHKLRAGQLDESGLTLVDLSVLSNRVAETLVNMYHGRIKYPWQEKKEREEAAARQSERPVPAPPEEPEVAPASAPAVPPVAPEAAALEEEAESPALSLDPPPDSSPFPGPLEDSPRSVPAVNEVIYQAPKGPTSDGEVAKGADDA